jgi:hypothetical protein
MKQAEFGADELARIAYLAWQREGCPQGRGLQYWLDWQAEQRRSKPGETAPGPPSLAGKRRWPVDDR